MEYQDFFAGHRLSVWTEKAGTSWCWAYEIDDGAVIEGDPMLVGSEAMVLGEGIDQARQAIRDLGHSGVA